MTTAIESNPNYSPKQVGSIHFYLTLWWAQ